MMNDRQAGCWSLSSGGGQTLHSQPEGLQPVLRILPRKPGAHHRPGGYFSEERRWPPVRVSRASANRTTGAEESCTTGPMTVGGMAGGVAPIWERERTV